MAEHEGKGSSMTLHAHGDGSYHTIAHGGEGYYGGRIGEGGKEPGRVDHESFGHAVMHMAKHHAEGDHFHLHGHDTGFTSHHVKEGGRVQGPDEHETMGAAKKHMGNVMDDDGDEG